MYAMYAALVDALGSGPALYDTCSSLEPHQRGRYRIRFRVPADWCHVGAFMVPVRERTQHSAEEGGDWHYPATPGGTFETWADGAEISALMQYQQLSQQTLSCSGGGGRVQRVRLCFL